MKRLLSILSAVLLTAGVALAQEKMTAEGDIKVEKAVAATSVENREPVGEATEFESTVGTVYCWSKISAASVPATIKHIWYVGDKQVFEKALDIKFPSTRTWTAKSVKPGSWRVDITDEAGTVLSSVSFTVK
ncbi:MAG: DUF2914 domain-containing protein [Terriglobia bacterium]